ncbi:ATP-binding cassette domain-containing protein [Streptomyces sp. NBC_00273]|uniref:ATP-binding cassette domain-containing protein n=1 Tax=Streptomyces sp. NBC_00273 TaxID=2903644 RepID=UPI002E2CF9DC|nr:ATP-binding cassette domain-containing protein [Streptomyces sp. NBC_00273]
MSDATRQDIAISVEGLTKRFGRTQALRGVSFTADTGSVVGVLGPGGAGKTTTLRVLATLLKPDSGRVAVGGYDVCRAAPAVRRAIGFAGQREALDEFLGGRENLTMIGRLSGMGRTAARNRADELLGEFGLTAEAERPVKSYSSAARRRLDLAACLVARPRILLLDEPTAGFDPRSQHAMWDAVKELVAEGTTLVLATQHLEEADRLADRLVILDRGRVVADGTPARLKAAAGPGRLEVCVSSGGDLPTAAFVLGDFTTGPATIDSVTRRILVHVDERPQLATDVVLSMQAAGISLDDCALRRPSLDEAFLALTAEHRNPTARDGAAAVIH